MCRSVSEVCPQSCALWRRQEHGRDHRSRGEEGGIQSAEICRVCQWFTAPSLNHSDSCVPLSALFVRKWSLRYHMAKSIKKATQLETLQHSADNQRRKQELVLRGFELDQNQPCFSSPCSLCLSSAIFFPTPNSACYMRDLLYSTVRKATLSQGSRPPGCPQPRPPVT